LKGLTIAVGPNAPEADCRIRDSAELLEALTDLLRQLAA
jgi:hypothetical protein